MLDGEIVVARGDRLDFEALQLRDPPRGQPGRAAVPRDAGVPGRLRPARARGRGPDGAPVPRAPGAPARGPGATPTRRCTSPARPPTWSQAREWFQTFEGAGLDGVVAKPLDGTYQPDKRTMFKVKHDRTADCVVAGFRWHKSGPVVGSLLLGLYREDGSLQHVGVAASFPMARRKSLLDELEPYRLPDGGAAASGHPWGNWADAQAHEDRRLPGNVSRWNAGKDLSFVPLRPELVVEVAYDQMEGDRFRHTAQFRRWRTDRDPAVVHVRAARPAGELRPRERPEPDRPAPGAERLRPAGQTVRRRGGHPWLVGHC